MTGPLRPSRTLLASACAAALAPALPAAAQGWQPEQVIRAEIRPGWRTPEGTHMAALHLHLAEGWKTYWRNPGASGVPPRFDWSASRNLAGVEVHWPRPELLERSGVRSLGFEKELVLPLEIRPADDAAPLHLAALVDLGVCESVCIPIQIEVAADLPAAGAPDPRIDAALAARPVPAAQAGLTAIGCRLQGIEDGWQLQVWLDLPPLGAEEAAVIELADERVWISPTTTQRDGDRLRLQADLLPLTAAGFTLDHTALHISVLGSDAAVDQRGCPLP